VTYGRLAMMILSQDLRFKRIRNFLALLTFIKYGKDLINMIRDFGIEGSFLRLFNFSKLRFYKFMKTYILKAQIKVKLDEVAIDFERSNFEGTEHLPSYSDLPEEGMNNTELSE